MNADRQSTHRVDCASYLRDDVWCIRAVALIAGGLFFAVVGFLPGVGLAVGALGLACAFLGVWVLSRSVGVVILTRTQSICQRGLVTERHVMFSDLSYIGVQPCEQEMSAVGWRPVPGGRYDVVVHLRGDYALLVGRDLRLSDARLVAERLGVLTGATVGESARTGRSDGDR
jgi:hypothetical protein